MLTYSQQQAHCNSCFQSIISIHNVHRCSLIQLEDITGAIRMSPCYQWSRCHGDDKAYISSVYFCSKRVHSLHCAHFIIICLYPHIQPQLIQQSVFFFFSPDWQCMKQHTSTCIFFFWMTSKAWRIRSLCHLQKLITGTHPHQYRCHKQCYSLDIKTAMSRFTTNNEILTSRANCAPTMAKCSGSRGLGGAGIVIRFTFNLLSASRSGEDQLSAED